MVEAVTGRAWRLGDGVTTDHIISGKHKYSRMGSLDAMLPHLLEEVIPGFHEKAREGDVIVAGRGFGYGSSREHAARLLRMAGIRVVVAESIHRIFYRNAVNNGILPIISATIPRATRTGDTIRVDPSRGVVENLTRGVRDTFTPPSPILLRIIEEGGMVGYIRRRGLPW